MELMNYDDAIKGGLSDGRKRALYVITKKLIEEGKSMEHIKNIVKFWNWTNNPPLRDVYIDGQMNYLEKKMEQGKKKDPNFVECDNVDAANQIDLDSYTFVRYSDKRDVYIFKRRSGK